MNALDQQPDLPVQVLDEAYEFDDSWKLPDAGRTDATFPVLNGTFVDPQTRTGLRLHLAQLEPAPL